jgi:uncharacterized caspase-like protein
VKSYDYTEAKIREAVAKLVEQLRQIGFDPYIDISENRIGIILPVEQIVNRIKNSVNNIPNLEVRIEEKAIGQKGYIVIRIAKKQ